MVFEFGPFTVDADVERTRAFYGSLPLITESCSCDGCRNYERAVAALPEEVRAFFAALGVDMRKACEVYAVCTNSDGALFYGGFYHICGRLLSGSGAWEGEAPGLSRWEEEFTFLAAPGFRVSFGEECSLLEENCPLPALQLDISAAIPWVLPEKNTYV